MLVKDDYDKMLQFISNIKHDDSNFRKTVMGLLQDIFGFSQLTFFLVDEEGHWTNPEVHNISNNSINQYAKYYYHKDIFHTINIPKELLKKNVVTVTDITTYSGFENSEFYNDFLKKFNLHYEIILPFTNGNRLIGVIGVFRPKELGGFSQKEIFVLDNLNKHIANSLKAHLDITQIKYEKYIFQNCTFHLPSGLIILNSQFSIIHYNETAKEFCQDITAKRAPLEAIKETLEVILAKFINQSFNDEISFKSYKFKIIPFMIPSKFNKIDSVYAIYIKKAVKEEVLPLEKIAQSYNLTERERDIVGLILQGLDNNPNPSILA